MICSRNTFSLLGGINKKRCFTLINQSRYIQLKPIPAIDNGLNRESYEQKNDRLKRPLSPHLSIYKPQLTTMLSISHRITGFALVGYAAFIAGTACQLYDVENVITYIQSLQLSSQSLFVARTIIAAPLAYHIANGIRHLIWDAGVGLSIKGVYITGYTVLIGTLVLSILMANV